MKNNILILPPVIWFFLCTITVNASPVFGDNFEDINSLLDNVSEIITIQENEVTVRYRTISRSMVANGTQSSNIIFEYDVYLNGTHHNFFIRFLFEEYKASNMFFAQLFGNFRNISSGSDAFNFYFNMSETESDLIPLIAEMESILMLILNYYGVDTRNSSAISRIIMRVMTSIIMEIR